MLSTFAMKPFNLTYRSNQLHVTHDSLSRADVFSGYQLASFRGLLLWTVLVVFAGIIVLYSDKIQFAQYCFLVLFGSCWFLLCSHVMHYFVLHGDCLIVKNHNLRWKRDRYELTKIKEIVFETQGTQPVCMRVIGTDLHQKVYPAATLKHKCWLALEKSLHDKGVQIRNECTHFNK